MIKLVYYTIYFADLFSTHCSFMTKIALGMAAIGRPHYINIKSADSLKNPNKELLHTHALMLLNSAYQMGIRHFDAAPGYGIAEEILLDWIKKEHHSDIDISTKWGYTYTANFEKNPLQHEVKEHSLHVLQHQWQYSKQLLPYLTTYQIHSATLDSGVLDNNEVLNELCLLKEQYNIEIGITTSGIHQNETIQKAIEIARNGKPVFTLFQATYNIFEQSILKSIDLLHAHKATLIVKEAMANGRILSQSKEHAILAKLAHKYHVGIDAIALRFCMDSIKPKLVLSGAATVQQLKENLLANTFELTVSEIDLLKSMQMNSNDYWGERKNLEWN